MKRAEIIAILKEGGYDKYSVEEATTRIDSLYSGGVSEQEISAWPPRDVVEKLIIGADILLHEKDYDAHGWEELEYCYRIAKQWLSHPTSEISEEGIYAKKVIQEFKRIDGWLSKKKSTLLMTKKDLAEYGRLEQEADQKKLNILALSKGAKPISEERIKEIAERYKFTEGHIEKGIRKSSVFVFIDGFRAALKELNNK